MAAITELIDKQDTFEIVRDQLAAILVLEIAGQKALATIAGRDPAAWDAKIYAERTNPIHEYLNSGSQTPVVNVWFERWSLDKESSSAVDRQRVTGVFNVDCYARGLAKDPGGVGHIAGDQDAAERAHAAGRLVRNILMAGHYTYLALRGTVAERWVDSLSTFQPSVNGEAVQQVVACRLAVSVSFNEFSPQVPAQPLELLSVDVNRAEDGQLVAEADYQYPL